MKQKQHKGKENSIKLPEKVKAELQAIKQAKECERKAEYQATKKKVNTNDLLNSPSQDAQATNASYGKATTRVKRTLPRSPQKKVLNKETKKVVVVFYKFDDTSCQALSKGDVVTTRDQQGKQNLQKRSITMGIIYFQTGTSRRENRKVIICSFATT